MVGLFLAPCLRIWLFFGLEFAPCHKVDLSTLVCAFIMQKQHCSFSQASRNAVYFRLFL